MTKCLLIFLRVVASESLNQLLEKWRPLVNITQTKFFTLKTLHSVSNDRTSDVVSSKTVLRVCESMKENCIEIRLVELMHDLLASVIRIQAATRKPKICSNGIMMRASAQKARPIHSLEKKKGKAANMVLFNTIIDYFTEKNLYVNESDVKTATKVVGILRDVLWLTDGHEVAAGEGFLQDLKGFAYENNGG